MTRRRLWALWLPVAIYMAIIFVLSSQQNPPALGPETLSDKSQHLLGYFGLGSVVCRALAGGFPRRVNRAAAIGKNMPHGRFAANFDAQIAARRGQRRGQPAHAPLHVTPHAAGATRFTHHMV